MHIHTHTHTHMHVYTHTLYIYMHTHILLKCASQFRHRLKIQLLRHTPLHLSLPLTHTPTYQSPPTHPPTHTHNLHIYLFQYLRLISGYCTALRSGSHRMSFPWCPSSTKSAVMGTRKVSCLSLALGMLFSFGVVIMGLGLCFWVRVLSSVTKINSVIEFFWIFWGVFICSVYVCLFLCVCECIDVRVYVCFVLCVNVCMHVCVWMFVCVCVCVCVCEWVTGEISG